MNKYRVGIVGLRGIAASPADPAPHEAFGSVISRRGGALPHASSYASVPSTEVVAVCDLDDDLTRAFIDQWGAVWNCITPYRDYREMLAHEQLDILSVATSDHRHAGIVVDAAEAGVKGIYCEKPIATNLEDADRMITTVEQHGTAMMVNYQRRWWPEFYEARRMIKSGELGQLREIAVFDCSPRAMIFRNATHWIDLINSFSESDPIWVIGHLDQEHEDYGTVYKGDGGRDADIEPGATAYIAYESGVQAYYCGTKSAVVIRETLLVCEGGRIRISPGLFEVDAPAGTRRMPWTQYERMDGVAAVHQLISEIETGKPTLSPPREARKALEIILAILHSQHHGNARIDLPLVEPVT